MLTILNCLFFLYVYIFFLICKIFESIDTIKFLNVCDFRQIQEICNKVVEKDSIMFKFVPNHFETQEICERTFKRFLYS